MSAEPGPISPEKLLSLRLVENLRREGLRPMEQARAFRALIAANGWTATRLAAEIHVGQGTISRALALLELPVEVQDRVERGGLSPSAAYEVSKVPGEAAQAVVAARIESECLTQAEAIRVVKEARERARAGIPPEVATRPATVELDLGDGMTVILRYRRACEVTPLHAIRRAVKILQDRERAGEPAGAA
jgi:ParB-like chromosome segregation protein Spo0J